jgi:hypothetical protein
MIYCDVEFEISVNISSRVTWTTVKKIEESINRVFSLKIVLILSVIFFETNATI